MTTDKRKSEEQQGVPPTPNFRFSHSAELDLAAKTVPERFEANMRLGGIRDQSREAESGEIYERFQGINEDTWRSRVSV